VEYIFILKITLVALIVAGEVNFSSSDTLCQPSTFLIRQDPDKLLTFPPKWGKSGRFYYLKRAPVPTLKRERREDQRKLVRWWYKCVLFISSNLSCLVWCVSCWRCKR